MADYDPMGALDIEKRTGIKGGEIDDFLRKVTSVQDAIQGLADGTVDPHKEIEIEGIETTKQKKEREALEAKRKVDYAERMAKKAAMRKQEEKDKWWRGAELFRECDPSFARTSEGGHDDDNDDDDNDEGSGGGGSKKRMSKEDLEEGRKQALLQRYSSDYGRWEVDITDDPASKDETAVKAAELEAKQNAEFEKNNPDFCNEFKADQRKRLEKQANTAENANVLRLKGNRLFKAKRYGEALDRYMGSLKEEPYAVNTLSNVAMVHLKRKEFADALQFCDRAIYLDASCVKARSRRAGCLQVGRFAAASVALLRFSCGNGCFLSQQSHTARMICLPPPPPPPPCLSIFYWLTPLCSVFLLPNTWLSSSSHEF